MIVSIINLIFYFYIFSRWPAPWRSVPPRLRHAPMPARSLVYEYANELKQVALPHMALDYQRRAITYWHTGLHDINHVRHSPPAAVISAYTTHSVRSACRHTYIAHNTITPDQPKSTGTAPRTILQTEASDRFRRHCEWFSWWTFYKKKKLDVHYGKYSLAKLHYIVFIDYCQSKMEWNNFKIKSNCSLDK